MIDSRDLTGLAARIKQALDQSKEADEADAAIIAFCETRRKEADRAQRDTDRLARENIAYLEGIQWLQYVEDRLINAGGRIRRGRVRITDNKLLDHARRLHARLQQVRYAPSVTPDTDDPGDAKSASAANAGLRWFYRRKKVAAEKRRTDWWIVGTGMCYLEAYYDPQAGPWMPLPVVRRDENGDVVLGPDGQPELEMEQAVGDRGEPLFDEVEVPDPVTQERTVQSSPRMRPKMELQPIGEADFVVRSPFQVRRDPRFQDWRQLRWLMVLEEVAVEDVLSRYGARVPGLESKLPQAQKTQPLPWIPEPASKSQDLVGLPRPSPSVGGVITLVRYYERPSGKHQDGRHFVYVLDTDILLHRGTLDTPDRDFPLVPLHYLERPWVLEGKSPVGDSKALQRLFNRILSRYGEHLIRLPSGWLLVPSNSGIPRNAFTNEVGSVIRHTPGSGTPTFVFPPFGQGLAWYDRFLMRIEAAIEDRMALPPAARGIMPKGARAARTVELLQEAADQVQAPVLGGIADGWITFYEKILGLMQRHYTVARLVAIQGPQKTAEIMEFKGSSIPRDWRDRLSVNVEAGESLPSSKLARMEMILTLARQHGLFGQPGTPEYIRNLRRALDLDAGFIQSDEDLDVTIAEHENIVMLHDGRVLPVRRIDDDWVHLSEHLTYAKRLIVSGREDDAAPHLKHAEAHWAQWTAKQASAAGQSGGAAQPPMPKDRAARLQRLRAMMPEASSEAQGGREQAGGLPGEEAQTGQGMEGPPPAPQAPAAATPEGGA